MDVKKSTCSSLWREVSACWSKLSKGVQWSIVKYNSAPDSLVIRDWIFPNLVDDNAVLDGVSWCSIFGLTCWASWKRRNFFVFREKSSLLKRLFNIFLLGRIITSLLSIVQLLPLPDLLAASLRSVGCHRDLPGLPLILMVPIRVRVVLLQQDDCCRIQMLWIQGFLLNLGSCTITAAEGRATLQVLLMA
ncbi:hypothetical protein GH714_011176 [Hevea brasiliensis]|uniref:Uncharacterized protein n=1 Tax=Hevea brasiliensis TaxID=3981 RepID=A0A6A6M0B4_HEVBR|nr:hypothetical protein GH714_011176 [Hevea brasiliensis]